MTLKENKIIVTGGTGFIGTHLVERLNSIGADIIYFTKGEERIDIRNWDSVNENEGGDILFHLAAIANVPYSWKNPRETLEINTLGTLNLLEFCRLKDIKKMIFISSYVYGRPQNIPIDENHPISPLNPYAESKVIGEEMCRGYSRDYGINCLVLRPFNIYGEGQRKGNLIPDIIGQLNQGKIELKDPEPKRDFLYIGDLIGGFISAGESDITGFEIFNLGFGKSYSVKDIVDRIVKIYGKQIEVNYTNERRKHEIMDTVAGIGKAQKMLNWSPQIDIEEGLKFTLRNSID
jgi:UDP-glucose 4-epimerase